MCPSNDVYNDYARTLIRVKAKQVVRGCGFNRSDLPDVEQELVFHLIKQASNFDPERSSLNTFIAKVVDSAVGMLVRRKRREKRSPGRGVQIQSLETTIAADSGSPTPLWATISPEDQDRKNCKVSLTDAEVVELVETVRFVLDRLPEDLQALCRHLMQTSRVDATRELKLSRRKLAVAMEEIRKHVRKLSHENF